MTTREAEQIQQVLDEAFACFRQENPEVAAAIDALGIPYVEHQAERKLLWIHHAGRARPVRSRDKRIAALGERWDGVLKRLAK